MSSTQCRPPPACDDHRHCYHFGCFSQRVIITLEADAWLACNTYCVCRVAELGSLSSGAKMAMKIFVKRVFTIFASNVSFLRVIAILQN